MELPKLCLTSFLLFTSLFLLAESAQPPVTCDPSNPSSKLYPFCNTTLPISLRVHDIISRLTLDEKISQLVNTAPPIPRLGIPAYQWWSEALHGVAFVSNSTYGIQFNGKIRAATSFPQVILTAASFDPDIWYRIGQVIGREARALFNAGQARGLTFWAPNINIYRDPRWGRGQETPGEDPLVSAKYAMLFVRGIQGDSFEGGKLGEEHLQASACCKHFTAYDLDNWKGISRFVFDANDHTKSAVKKKKLPESQIDRALQNLFSVRMRLGLFNGNPAKQPFGNIGYNEVCSTKHQRLALDAARGGIVLLKNSHRLLPLSKAKTRSLAVIGPNANIPHTLLGNYEGPPCKTVTPLQALQKYVKNTRYHPGCNTVSCSSPLIDEAVKIAKEADHVMLIMGLDQTEEREDFDRLDLLLPGKQKKLITSIARVAKNPVVLVLLCGGPVDISFAKYEQNIGSILWAGYPGEAGGQALAEIVFGDHNPGGRLPVTWYPQSFTITPMTDMRMRAAPSSGYPGRTYRFYEGPTIFDFGYGLSYSNYSYQFLSIAQTMLYFNQHPHDQINRKPNSIRFVPVSEIGPELCQKRKFTVTVGVQNSGEMAGKHPVLLFVRQARLGNGNPKKQLIAFQSVNLKAGGRAEIKFEVSPCEHLSRANVNGLMVIEEGSYFLIVENKEYEIRIII
ncbi:hypothetical protein COLO4_16443 [Corchorus olitorius]|uniref:Fibronectin type III-like domain-containing protein n=1 Tax=Corchorus olitorius TaxID=93759 RepID=A0A1R3JHD2_9ROSI|nr:hypothetical protein COLO4_16443 [Corchorus olitorius]